MANFWFKCSQCKWRGIRYANQRKCPYCLRWRTLVRGEKPTKAEQDAEFNRVLAEWKKIPD